MSEMHWVPTDRLIGEDEDGAPIVETEDGPVRGLRLSGVMSRPESGL